MPEQSPMVAEVFLDAQVRPEHERQLCDALAALNITAKTKVVPARRAADPITWLALVLLPLAAIGNKLGEDGYQAFKAAVRHLLARRTSAAGGPPGVMVVQDTRTGLQIILEHDLPDDAYQQLFRLDLGQFRLGPVRYDRPQRRWRSELDEANPSG